MKRFHKLVSMFIILLFGLSMLTVTSCGWKPSEEDIKLLEETKSAALAAEKKVADTQKEREALEAKVAAKKAELEKVKSDLEKVKAAAEAAQEEME